MMAPPYRIEREPMARGQLVPTFRVIVSLPRQRWGTVQAGLLRQDADGLLAHLMLNEAAKEIMRQRDGLFQPIAARHGLAYRRARP